MGTFCVLPLVPITSPAWNASADVAPPAWAVCDNDFAGGASCTAAASRSYALADALAHAPLADCLEAMRPLYGNMSSAARNATEDDENISAVQFLAPALFYDAAFDARWAGDVTAGAAPAVRRAALDYGMRSVTAGGYENVTLLRCGNAKRHMRLYHVPVRMPHRLE
jgi:hypothetical protein